MSTTPTPAATPASETPRTDAAIKWVGGNVPSPVVNEMRQLERELAAAVAEKEEAEDHIASLYDGHNIHHQTLLRTKADLTTARSRIAELEGALEELAREEFRDDDDPILEKARSRARAALTPPTGGPR